ncbi:hypothetical protein HDV00_008009 [Rhizophlyctis rosea]|nr:hypothetical protein HDV00_008009 [Rhizophlyctis rosea]
MNGGVGGPLSSMPPTTPGGPLSNPGSVPSAAGSSKPVSLYRQCLSLIEILYSIPGFDAFLFPDGYAEYQQNPTSFDPIHILWSCFRLGTPICHLYNQLRPQKPLEVPDLGPNPGVNDCKKPLARFVMAWKIDMGMPEEDVFSISKIFTDDTNEFVKLVKTLQILTDKLAQMGLLKVVPLPFALPALAADTQQMPTDNRGKLITEMLNTERTYNQDLEKLHNYQKDLQKQASIPRPLMSSLFANLPELLDFERRFLFQMEATLALPAAEQRIGALFIQNEDAFETYIPFCGNYQLATQYAMEEAALLQAANSEIDPVRGLPNYLIKPVQRICRYPLLLSELIKLSDPQTYPYVDEVKEGLACIKRVVDKVNEEKRKEENRMVKKDLDEKIEDWKGLDSATFGELLLHDKFPMASNDQDKDYNLFLFESILLCCKDLGKKKKKKKDATQEVTLYSLKGNIYVTSIAEVVDASKPASQFFLIKVFWRDGANMESFALKCRNIEQVNLWKGRLDELLLQERMRKKSLADNNPYASNTQLNPDIIGPNMYNPQSQYSSLDGDYDDDYYDGPPAPPYYESEPVPQGPHHRRALSRGDSDMGSSQYSEGGWGTPPPMPNMQRSKSNPNNYYPPANMQNVPQGRKSTPAQPRSGYEYAPKSPKQRPLSSGGSLHNGVGPGRTSPVPPMPTPYGGANYDYGVDGNGYSLNGQQMAAVYGGERSASRSANSRYGGDPSLPSAPPPQMPLPPPPQFPPGGPIDPSPRHERPSGPPQSPLPQAPGAGWGHARRPSGQTYAPVPQHQQSTGAYFDNFEDYISDGEDVVYDVRGQGGIGGIAPSSGPTRGGFPPSPPPSTPGSPHGRNRRQPPPISTRSIYGAPDEYAPRSPADVGMQRPPQHLYGGEHPPRSSSHLASVRAQHDGMYRSASVPDIFRATAQGPAGGQPSGGYQGYGQYSSSVGNGNGNGVNGGYDAYQPPQYDLRSDSRGPGGRPYGNPPNGPLPQAPSGGVNGPAMPVPMPRRANTAFPSVGGGAPAPIQTTNMSFPAPPSAAPPQSALPQPQSALAPSFIKVKTHFGDDVFVIAVPSRGCSFQELSSKIERKIRLCGANVPEGRRLRMRYRDEDGDFITVNNDDDVGLAFESSRNGVGGEKGVVNLFVQ